MAAGMQFGRKLVKKVVKLEGRGQGGGGARDEPSPAGTEAASSQDCGVRVAMSENRFPQNLHCSWWSKAGVQHCAPALLAPLLVWTEVLPWFDVEWVSGAVQDEDKGRLHRQLATLFRRLVTQRHSSTHTPHTTHTSHDTRTHTPHTQRHTTHSDNAHT